MTWLILDYGCFLPQDMAATNQAQLTKPWNPSKLFQFLTNGYLEATQIAANGNLPILDAELINYGIVTLKQTGTLEKYINKWNDLQQAACNTWVQFDQFFEQKILKHQ